MTVDTAQLQVLFVEDDLGDVALMKSAFADHVVATELHHVADDAAATLAFLRREGGSADAARPDLILLDLNMPRVDGRQVLNEIKADEELKSIPVVVFTTSATPADIVSSYSSHANAYVSQADRPRRLRPSPGEIRNFYGYTVTLPRRISDLTRHDGSGGEAAGASQPSS